MTLIDEVLSDLGERPSLHDILRVVYCYYLTEKEKEHYQILLLYYNGKPQRELGILLNVQQYKVSEYLSRLQHKLKKIAAVFTYRRDKFERFLNFLKKRLTEKQYYVVSCLFAGNKQCEIARHLKCSPAAVFYTIRQINTRLSITKRKLFEKYSGAFLS